MQVNDIRSRMATLRVRSASSATQLETAVERMKDWREHFRAHPWLAGGAALLTAYALVPNRQGTVMSRRSAAPMSLGEMAESSVLGSPGSSGSLKENWKGKLGRMAANMAVSLAVKAIRARMVARQAPEPPAPNPTLPFGHPDRNGEDWST